MREPRQKIRFPDPRIAVSAVHEEQRRLAAVAARARGQVAADLEIGLDWEHRVIEPDGIAVEVAAGAAGGVQRLAREIVLGCAPAP